MNATGAAGVRVRLAAGRSAREAWSFPAGRAVAGVVVGAASDCDWVLEGAGIAARHMKLAFDGAYVWLTNLDAEAAVAVDGNAITEDWVAVRAGSVVALGEASLRVEALPASDASVDDDASLTLEASLPSVEGGLDGPTTRVELAVPGRAGPLPGASGDAGPTQTLVHAPWASQSEDDTLIQSASVGRASPLGPAGARAPRPGVDPHAEAVASRLRASTEVTREVALPGTGSAVPSSPRTADAAGASTPDTPPRGRALASGMRRGLALRAGGGLLALLLGVGLATVFAEPDEPAPTLEAPRGEGAPAPALPLPALGAQGATGLAPGMPSSPFAASTPVPSRAPWVAPSGPAGLAPSPIAQAVAFVAERRYAEAALAYETLSRAEPGRPELALVARVMRARAGSAP